MRVVSVDDSKAVHAYLRDVFKGRDVTLEHFFDGEEILKAMEGPEFGSPEVVLLDWEMPTVSGIEALPRIRAKLPSTVIIMATSKNAMEDIAAALDKGASDYMMKPFTKDILLGKIEQLVGKRTS